MMIGGPVVAIELRARLRGQIRGLVIARHASNVARTVIAAASRRRVPGTNDVAHIWSLFPSIGPRQNFESTQLTAKVHPVTGSFRYA